MSARPVMAAARHRTLGVAFLALLVFFAWGTYAIYS